MNKQTILAQMAAVVKASKTSDFFAEEKDIRIVKDCMEYRENELPMIWQCGRQYLMSSFVYPLNRKIKEFANHGKCYQDYLNGVFPFSFLWNETNGGDLFFIIDSTGLHMMADSAALEKAVRSAFKPYLPQA